jgi:UDP-glucose 4-epimerase
MKILLIGATGFLGTEVSQLLHSKNLDFATVSRNGSNKVYAIDISNYSDFEALPKNYFDIIINCATTLPGGNYLDNNYLEKIYKTNILGTQNICKWANEQQTLKKIINCSTLVVVQKPWLETIDETANTYPTGNHVLYCSSKLMQELLFDTFCTSKNITITHVRFSALYGTAMPWNGIICNFIDQAKNNKKITLTNGNFVNADFLNSKDAANILLKAIENDIDGILNAASGSETSLLMLAKIIAASFDTTITIENNDLTNKVIDSAKINTKKLEKYIRISDFISLNEGIKSLIAK